MVRHPLGEIPHHRSQMLIAQVNMIGMDPKHLTPAFAASGLEYEVDVFECLIDLGIEVGIVGASLRIPAAWKLLVESRDRRREESVE